MSNDHRALLQAYFESALRQWRAPLVGPVGRITDGWESELYTLDVAHGPAGARLVLRLVLRLYPGNGAERKAEHEYRGMRRLQEAGYPVPTVHHLALADSPLGRPFILMDRIEGAPMWPGLALRPAAEQEDLLTVFCALFVRLHRLDWRRFVDDPQALAGAGPLSLIDRAVTDARRVVVQFELTGFDPLVDWLADHRHLPAGAAPSVVHRDFHPGNVLVRADGSAVVIDWSNLGVTDARFDLAWTLVLAHAHAGTELRDALLTGYERASGASVEDLGYFEAFAGLRRLIDLTVALGLGPARMGMRPEALELMRAQLPAAAAVHRLVHERTGLWVPEVERMLTGY